MSEEKKVQEEIKQFLGNTESSEDDTSANDIVELEEKEEVQEEDDEETEDQDDATEDQEDEEDEDPGEADPDEEEDTEEEDSPEEADTDGTSESQDERYLKIIESLAKKKQTEKPATPAAPDIYESDEFKGLIEVLDLDKNEAKVMMAFMKRMQSDTQQRSVEQAMKDTPEVVGKYVNRQSVMTRMKEKFYKDNPQLEAVKSYVAQVANTVSANNADWTMEQVLTEAAEVTYTALGIKKELAKKTDKPGKRKKPAFAKGTKGSRKKTPKVPKLQNDIQKMLNLD